MTFLLFLPMLLVPFSAPQEPNTSADAPVSVLSFKWFKDRRFGDSLDGTVTAPSETNDRSRTRNVVRSPRVVDNSGMRDQNGGGTRTPAGDRMARDQFEPIPPPVEGFTYRARIQNKSTKAMKAVFLQFEFTEKANRANISRRQFVCRAKVKPDKREDLSAFSLNGPSNVVSVRSLSNKSGGEFQESVVINRVEYDDGSVWQREGWNFDEVKLTLKSGSNRVQPCRGLQGKR